MAEPAQVDVNSEFDFNFKLPPYILPAEIESRLMAINNRLTALEQYIAQHCYPGFHPYEQEQQPPDAGSGPPD